MLPPTSPAATAASPAHAPTPEAPQAPSGTPEAVGQRIAPVGLEAVAPSWPSSYRSLIGIGSGIGTIAGVGRAVRIAQTPSTTGHGAHPTRSCSIKAWHLVHLLSIRHQCGYLWAILRYHHRPLPLPRRRPNPRPNRGAEKGAKGAAGTGGVW